MSNASKQYVVERRRLITQSKNLIRKTIERTTDGAGEDDMKYFSIGITTLLIFLVVSDLGADKLYTWTDEHGNLHITEKPPPENATLKNVMNYQPEPEKEVLESQHRQETSVRDAFREEQIQKSRQARMDADKAKKEADQARARADEALAEPENTSIPTLQINICGVLINTN